MHERVKPSFLFLISPENVRKPLVFKFSRGIKNGTLGQNGLKLTIIKSE